MSLVVRLHPGKGGWYIPIIIIVFLPRSICHFPNLKDHLLPCSFNFTFISLLCISASPPSLPCCLFTVIILNSLVLRDDTCTHVSSLISYLNQVSVMRHTLILSHTSISWIMFSLAFIDCAFMVDELKNLLGIGIDCF